MVFSRLLLAVDSKSYISGKRPEDKICVKVNAGEIALCFQIDDKERRVSRFLDLDDNDKRCDGVVFYAKQGENSKVICLVEMKGVNTDNVVQQIKETKRHIGEMLSKECSGNCNQLLSRIKWKACYYSYGSSDSKQKLAVVKDLKADGFEDVKDFDRSKNDITDFLRGAVKASSMARNLRRQKS